MHADADTTDLLEAGIFTVPEAARLVGAPQAQVRLWAIGRAGRQDPVIENELGRVGGKDAVSFTNLMELRFVSVFSKAGLNVHDIREIIDEAKRCINHPHPFAHKVIFKTDGDKVVAVIERKKAVDVVYDLRSKNYEMLPVVTQSLRQDVIYDPSGDAVAWYPRKTIAPHILVSPKIAFGKPVLEGSHIPTATLAKAVEVEGSVAVVADLFDIPVGRVREAVAFEKELRRVH